MEEILHQLVDGLSHYNLTNCIMAGAGFLPSTVSTMKNFQNLYDECWIIETHCNAKAGMCMETTCPWWPSDLAAAHVADPFALPASFQTKSLQFGTW